MVRLRLAPMAVAVLAALGACANPRADSAASAQQSLVGLPKAVLLQCAGAPTRTAQADGIEVLTYDTTKLQADRTHFSAGFGWGRGWGGWGSGLYDGGGTESRSCQAHFTLRDGKVAKVIYGSADSEGSSRLNQCFAVVENCVPPLAK